MPAFDLAREASHHAIATIDAFYSWTEHLFVHLAILQGRCVSGSDVAQLAAADWATKYKRAISLDAPKSKSLFDELLSLRRQVRNFTAHGSFGKDGAAFSFHSAAGAVPVVIGTDEGAPKYSLVRYPGFQEAKAINLIDAFLDHVWDDSRRPARLHLLESDLPVILTLVQNGTYTKAMGSEEQMVKLLRELQFEFDRSANMDW